MGIDRRTRKIDMQESSGGVNSKQDKDARYKEYTIILLEDDPYLIKMEKDFLDKGIPTFRKKAGTNPKGKQKIILCVCKKWWKYSQDDHKETEKQVTSVEVTCLRCDRIFTSSDLTERGTSIYRLCKKCRKRKA